MHNAVMCTLNLYDVIGITHHLHIKSKSFSKIAQPLHKETVRGCSFLYIIVKIKGIMSEAFLVDVSIYKLYLCTHMVFNFYFFAYFFSITSHLNIIGNIRFN